MNYKYFCSFISEENDLCLEVTIYSDLKLFDFRMISELKERILCSQLFNYDKLDNIFDTIKIWLNDNEFPWTELSVVFKNGDIKFGRQEKNPIIE